MLSRLGSSSRPSLCDGGWREVGASAQGLAAPKAARPVLPPECCLSGGQSCERSAWQHRISHPCHLHDEHIPGAVKAAFHAGMIFVELIHMVVHVKGAYPQAPWLFVVASQLVWLGGLLPTPL